MIYPDWNAKKLKESSQSYLLISGIQHYLFCPRQWGLIHIEQQWAENYFTASGEIMHNRVHDSDSSYKRKELLSLMSLRVFSDKLKIEGVCDAVEFRSDENGVELFGRPGRWSIMPVEYKRGESKADQSDILQVVAQATCLEEMFGCRIEKCAIYYGKTHSRDYVQLDSSIREKLIKTLDEMHKFYDRHITPKTQKNSKCKSCSLIDICVPSLFDEQGHRVAEYIQAHIEDKV